MSDEKIGLLTGLGCLLIFLAFTSLFWIDYIVYKNNSTLTSGTVIGFEPYEDDGETYYQPVIEFTDINGEVYSGVLNVKFGSSLKPETGQKIMIQYSTENKNDIRDYNPVMEKAGLLLGSLITLAMLSGTVVLLFFIFRK